MALFSPCPRGLEDALAHELLALNTQVLRQVPGGVEYDAFDEESELELSYRVNLHSRIASRVLIRLALSEYRKESALYELAYEVPWESIFDWRKSLRVDTSATRSPLKSLNFANLLIKDAICDRLRDKAGDRPSIDTEAPDVRVFLFMDDRQASLYLDTSGENLFKRGWRRGDDKGAAPLKENLAAGLISLSAWTPEQAFADLFCGSGTIAIEAAQQAYGIAPGLQRRFSVENLLSFEPEKFRTLREAALTKSQKIIRTAEFAIQASDADSAMISIAKINAQTAGLPAKAIRFSTQWAERAKPSYGDGRTGVILSNPPYGERMEQSFDPLALTQNFKEHFGGWKACILTTDRDLPRKMRLRESRKVPLYNGTLECRLFSFEVNPKPSALENPQLDNA